jgi:hypothetical protein
MAEQTIINRDPDLDLDFMDLQTAVSRQTSLYDYYAQKCADARADRDEAVNRLDARSAQVELRIRQEAEAAKQKITIPEVTAQVAANEELIGLRQDVVDKNREYLRLDAKVRALDHKKTMIECAVRMTLSKSYNMSEDGVSVGYAEQESTASVRRGLNHKE